MALTVLMLRKRLNDDKKALDELRAKDADFEKREAELEQSIEEAETEEEKQAVEEAISEYEKDKAEHAEKKESLERKIEEIETDISEEERQQDTTPEVPEEREVKIEMDTREITMDKRAAIFERDEVKGFVNEFRSAIREKRAITNIGLTIPEVMLGLLRENIENYSKLYKHVTVRAIRGNGRELIMGTIPEAVWTDCCASLNELSLTFNDVEVGCWKVGGYFAVCNANIEDSDLDLMSEILTAIGQAIGYALDKAILYGTGTRMPQGIMTRLVQTARPDDYSATARAWTDLHTSNIKSHANTVVGAELFRAFVLDSGAAKGKYAKGEKTWVMNETTYTNLVAQALTVDASGNIVTGIAGTMPVIGGKIETLNFVPDNVIIGGYFENYLLAERAGNKFATSEHVRFLQDQTVMKGTARYDGKPVIAEAFVAIGINGVTPTATMAFAPDEANSNP